MFGGTEEQQEGGCASAEWTLGEMVEELKEVAEVPIIQHLVGHSKDFEWVEKILEDYMQRSYFIHFKIVILAVMNKAD